MNGPAVQNLRKTFKASQFLQNMQLCVIFVGQLVLLLKRIARRTYHKDFDNAENFGACVERIENGTEASKAQSLVDYVAVK